MNPDFRELDQRVAQARVALSGLALSSMYVDPSTGGLFDLGKWLLATLLCHLIYSSLTFVALRYRGQADRFGTISTILDLIFATSIAFFTEGRTSPSFVFFVFAIVAAGFRTGFRDTLMVTSCSVALYVVVVALSDGFLNIYMMRAVYLAIAGYLIGFFGHQRNAFEAHVRELEAQSERQEIARSLHDGYIQALAALSLKLESCRDMMIHDEAAEALVEINEIQAGVNHEYDEVRAYLRSLASAAAPASGGGIFRADTQFRVTAGFVCAGTIVEHVIQILLEGIRNTRKHGNARSAAIKVEQAAGTIRISIDDDGIGFKDPAQAPWTIASRVAEFGGRVAISSDCAGAHLEIAIPTD